ncbi:MAG: DNA mismatch repair protein MutS, partial [Gammaproteobacteria bacterium]|nr:DNA mismatch repair protein MutS [Gammaproteobacteria bacterium]
AKSLVLMDEIGRATSRVGGLVPAGAVAEHLALKSNAFTLFATHYFELTQLPEQYSNIANVHLDAVEHGDDVIFMHSVKPGPANQSYGLQVARLAGIPAQTIQLARHRLQLLERQSMQPQGDLFTEPAAVQDSTPHALLTEMDAIDPDELTPKQALELIYRLKQLAKP